MHGKQVIIADILVNRVLHSAMLDYQRHWRAQIETSFRADWDCMVSRAHMVVLATSGFSINMSHLSCVQVTRKEWKNRLGQLSSFSILVAKVESSNFSCVHRAYHADASTIWKCSSEHACYSQRSRQPEKLFAREETSQLALLVRASSDLLNNGKH